MFQSLQNYWVTKMKDSFLYNSFSFEFYVGLFCREAFAKYASLLTRKEVMIMYMDDVEGHNNVVS